ncbi:hypothetical protein [Rhizobium binae]|uniref:hypothetical protein n=1 Tax=Rhizobium binae TaxID=1138190 RepID=UPI001C838080|nr:hypothetical protein [Rhizobium binae]MBX4967719.1 hypothetical protein [Rhizobium binae]
MTNASQRYVNSADKAPAESSAERRGFSQLHRLPPPTHDAGTSMAAGTARKRSAAQAFPDDVPPGPAAKRRRLQGAKTTLQTLPFEIKHNIIAHAVNDTDYWRAYETYLNVSLASRDLRGVTKALPMSEFKENLAGGHRIAEAVVKAYFRDGRFSDNDIGSNQRHIGDETAAVSGILEFRSPEERTRIFESIAKKEDVLVRMLGYSNIAAKADLFKKHEIAKMDGDALNAFKEHGGWPNGKNLAAQVLAIRYDDIEGDYRLQIRQVLFEDVQRRIEFSKAILDANRSLLKHDDLRTMVLADVDTLPDPHGALAVIASYIDKNSPRETNFIIKESLQYIREFGEEHGHDGAALAIARVFEGTVKPENVDRVNELRGSDCAKGRTLAAAFETVQRGRAHEVPIEGRIEGTSKLLRQLEASKNNPDHNPSRNGVLDVTRSNHMQMKAARVTLINTIRERDNRAR